MLARIVPAGVVTDEMFTDMPDVMLFPAEQAAIERAVPKRRAEFATVRHCARRALAQLGQAPAPLVPGANGEPTWPVGFVGSMTHCAGYRAVAVAPAQLVRTIGVDAEPHAPLPGGVLDLVSDAHERAHLRELAQTAADVHWDRLLFSAKESVYKAWFPLIGRWLGFEDAHVSIDIVAGTFAGTFAAHLHPPVPAQITVFRGRWIVADGLVATAIVETGL